MAPDSAKISNDYAGAAGASAWPRGELCCSAMARHAAEVGGAAGLVWTRQGVKLTDTLSLEDHASIQRWSYFSIFFGWPWCCPPF